MRTTLVRIVCALALAIGCAPHAAAQAWPAKTVRLVAVFPPGGSVDQVARILAQQLTAQTGQQVIVENKGGASGSIGTAQVAKADPDGYTLAVVFDTHAVNPSLIPNLPYDTLKDLTPIMLVGTGGTILTSVDGANWVQANSGTTADLNAVLFGLNGYSIVGAGGVNLNSF